MKGMWIGWSKRSRLLSKHFLESHMMDIYREQLLDHYHHPRGWGLAATADYEAEEYNQICGDQVKVQMETKDEVVVAMHFEGHGCAVSLASASLLTELVAGKRVQDIGQLGLSDIEEVLGTKLTPTRAKCALLSLVAAQKALSSYAA